MRYVYRRTLTRKPYCTVERYAHQPHGGPLPGWLHKMTASVCIAIRCHSKMFRNADVNLTSLCSRSTGIFGTANHREQWTTLSSTLYSPCLTGHVSPHIGIHLTFLWYLAGLSRNYKLHGVRFGSSICVWGSRFLTVSWSWFQDSPQPKRFASDYIHAVCV